MLYQRCENMSEDLVCLTDPSVDLKIRFYDITVTATDSAGNTGADTCKVIIVPSCDPLGGDGVDICVAYQGVEHPDK